MGAARTRSRPLHAASTPVPGGVDDSTRSVAEVTCGCQFASGFDGFPAPVSSGTFDSVNAVAGKFIPFRFTSTGAFGQPATALPAGVSVAVSAGSAGASTTIPATDDVKGKASLLSLGGVCEFRWEGSRADRGRCRLVGIALADGVPHTAMIQFAP